MLARAFLPTKKAGGTIIAMSSAFSSLPPAIPFLAGSSAYSISKMGTARFYEFLANKNPDLNVFMLHPGLIRTALYDKSKLELDANIDTGKPAVSQKFNQVVMLRLLMTSPQFNFPLISQCGWRAPRLSRSLAAFCLQIGMWNS